VTRPTGPPCQVILYEGIGSRPLPQADRGLILRSLLEKGFPVSCARGNGSLALTATGGSLLVLGRFLQQNPALAIDDRGAVRVQFHDIEGLGPDNVLAIAEQLRTESQPPQPRAWKPWFPVIDYSRCTNCMQCLSFCLFEVYAVSPEGKIRVQNQSNCKTDCPACSRVCPEVAILFPKYRHSPINGDEVNTEDVRREAMKVDISALLGGDIYAALRDRSTRAKSRFSKERDEERALKERQRCLIQLQQKLDIPPEVLASLPSLDEIRAKAEAAKVRSQAALADAGEGISE
jgi:NAD-dependent dihydropyrimidine dehydrogenase PreA subunit